MSKMDDLDLIHIFSKRADIILLTEEIVKLKNLTMNKGIVLHKEELRRQVVFPSKTMESSQHQSTSDTTSIVASVITPTKKSMKQQAQLHLQNIVPITQSAILSTAIDQLKVGSLPTFTNKEKKLTNLTDIPCTSQPNTPKPSISKFHAIEKNTTVPNNPTTGQNPTKSVTVHNKIPASAHNNKQTWANLIKNNYPKIDLQFIKPTIEDSTLALPAIAAIPGNLLWETL